MSEFVFQEGNFIGSFHDATMLYLLALNETLAAGSSATNGTEITRRMRNRSFEGLIKIIFTFLKIPLNFLNTTVAPLNYVTVICCNVAF